MPSPSASIYQSSEDRARVLLSTALDARLRPISRSRSQTYLHASLAAYVAGWDAYVHNLVRDFFQAVADPLTPKFHFMHDIARSASETAMKRFNTPNWDNSRNIIMQYTGYDPITDWVWARRGWLVAQVRDRLDQILQVRHSFAHGFPIPAYSWTQTASGDVRLTAQCIHDTQRFFANLVSRTDQGMSRHITSVFGVAPPW